MWVCNNQKGSTNVRFSNIPWNKFTYISHFRISCDIKVFSKALQVRNYHVLEARTQR